MFRNPALLILYDIINICEEILSAVLMGVEELIKCQISNILPVICFVP